jgi:hypothetical protein
MKEVADMSGSVGGSNPRAAGESDTSGPTVVAGQVDPARKSGRSRRRLSLIPNQHGAWAFLVVPLLLGFAVAGWSWVGAGFAFAWVVSYPLSFYSMRVIRAWLKRHRLTRVARRDLRAAAFWAVPLTLVGIPLLILRPWLLVVAAVAAVLWSVSLWLSLRGRERSVVNDLLLVAQAVTAVPLMWAVTTDSVAVGAFPAVVWELMALSAVYFTGTVIHVKSLIRKSKDRRWHWGSVAYHVVALVVMPLLSVWFVIPFAACLARSLFLKPGMKPAAIGGVEIVMSLLVLLAGVLTVATS